MTDERPGRAGSRPLVVTLCLLSGLALLWIVGTVPSGGPDEPVHLVRGAALVRGEASGDTFPGQGRVFELPAWIGHPDHGCFSTQELQPADCATAAPRPTGDRLLVTTAWRYPIWGHLPAGLATYLPASVGNQAARVFDAIIPIALISAAATLARRRSPAALGSLALAMTPMAWFSIIVVNPSGLVIAGGLTLWVGLLHGGWLQRRSVPVDTLTSWTIAAGWAAAVLPRRDGMIWAAMIACLCVLFSSVDLPALLRRLGRGPQAVIAVSTLATLAWAATADTNSSKLLLVMPLLPVAAVGAQRAWTSAALATVGRRIGALIGAGIAVLLAIVAAMAVRPGGYDSELLARLVGQTGINLEEAIGLLGWLDTPLPRSALFLWLATLGVLAGGALMSGSSRAVAAAIGVVLVGIVAAWVLEMNQGSTTGTYWQGRYYLPLLIGVPVVLGWSIGEQHGDSEDDHSTQRPLLVAVVSAAMTVMTLAFAASMRRWGVGTSGSIDPRNWNTYGSMVSPSWLLVAHVTLAVGLVVVAVRATNETRSLARMSPDVPTDSDTLAGHEQ